MRESFRTSHSGVRGIFKLVAMAFGALLLLVLLTGIVRFIRHNWFGSFPGGSNHVRVVDVSGVIMSSSAFTRDLEEILKNKRTKAIVVRVNSPGGLVAPSQEIYQALRKADEKIPVFISMGTLAASGGYYIALGGRKIFANAGTLTGSIGVIMEFINTMKLYEWAKLERFAITSGKFKDAGSPLKEMGPEAKALFQGMVTDIYKQFRGAVKERRKLDEATLDKYTDGRVVTGTQALEAKLVDAIGTFEDVLKEARTIAGLPVDGAVVYPSKDEGLLRRLLMGDAGEEASAGWLSFLNRASSQLPTSLPGPSWRVLWLAPVQ